MSNSDEFNNFQYIQWYNKRNILLHKRQLKVSISAIACSLMLSCQRKPTSTKNFRRYMFGRLISARNLVIEALYPRTLSIGIGFSGQFIIIKFGPNSKSLCKWKPSILIDFCAHLIAKKLDSKCLRAILTEFFYRYKSSTFIKTQLLLILFFVQFVFLSLLPYHCLHY